MDYRILAIVAMISYGLFQYGIKLTTSSLPGVSVLLVSNISVFVPTVIYVLYSGAPVTESFASAGPWILGLIGGVSFVFLFTAMKAGPASVVAPIYGLYMVMPVLLGIIFLEEGITIMKTLGIIFAILAAILLSIQ